MAAARDLASVAYDVAKKAARLGRAKGAHDDLIAAAYRTQADALEIEALAKRRLADEYDAAQERGEVAKHSSGNPQIVPNHAESEAKRPPIPTEGGHRFRSKAASQSEQVAAFDRNAWSRSIGIPGRNPRNPHNQNDLPATSAQVGISRKEIHEARIIRDAEKSDPGIVRRTVDAALASGEEPSKAKVRRAVLETARPQSAARPAPQRHAAKCRKAGSPNRRP